MKRAGRPKEILTQIRTMAEQQAIKLHIGGKSYSFVLKRDEGEPTTLAEKEELYRLAEREVNAYAARLEKNRYDGFSTQDYLALTALQLAISNIGLTRSRNLASEDLERLEELDDRIDAYLNRL